MDKNVKLRTFGSELMMLYGRINLSQSEFANAVGVSSVALRKWESSQSCPKAESVKRVIEILIHKGAFKRGGEQTEALHLWELAMQRGLKAPFDEVWFLGIESAEAARAEPSEAARVEPNISVGADRGQLCLVPSADPVQGSEPQPYTTPVSYPDPNPTSPNGLTLAPTKTQGQGKRLLAMLILLVILLTIGLACVLFFYAKGHATVHTSLGQQNKMAVVTYGSTMIF